MSICSYANHDSIPWAVYFQFRFCKRNLHWGPIERSLLSEPLHNLPGINQSCDFCPPFWGGGIYKIYLGPQTWRERLHCHSLSRGPGSRWCTPGVYVHQPLENGSTATLNRLNRQHLDQCKVCTVHCLGPNIVSHRGLLGDRHFSCY